MGYAAERETLINMGNGIRTLNIASPNPDSMKEEQTQQDIIKSITGNKIHIAAIPETQIANGRSYLLGDYRIIIASSREGETAGVAQGRTAIMIREITQQYITQITMPSRVLRVTMDHAKSRMSIEILSTYAPHNGNAEEERRKRRGEVKEIINKTCKGHLLIWCADTNGRLGIDEERGGEKKPHTTAPSRE